MYAHTYIHAYIHTYIHAYMRKNKALHQKYEAALAEKDRAYDALKKKYDAEKSENRELVQKVTAQSVETRKLRLGKFDLQKRWNWLLMNTLQKFRESLEKKATTMPRRLGYFEQ